MPQGVGSAKAVRSQADVFGGKLFEVIDYSGPLSYVQGGDAMDPRMFGFPNAIIMLIGFNDHSNTYTVDPRALQNGVTPWQLVWTVVSTGAEVAAGVNLSGSTVRLMGLGI